MSKPLTTEKRTRLLGKLLISLAALSTTDQKLNLLSQRFSEQPPISSERRLLIANLIADKFPDQGIPVLREFLAFRQPGNRPGREILDGIQKILIKLGDDTAQAYVEECRQAWAAWEQNAPQRLLEEKLKQEKLPEAEKLRQAEAKLARKAALAAARVERANQPPKVPRNSLISSQAAAALLGVSPEKVLDWREKGTVRAYSTYKNSHGGQSYLFDPVYLQTEETQSRLAPLIADFKRRSASGKKAAAAQVAKVKAAHDTYLEAIENASGNEAVTDVLRTGYYLWHLNHLAKKNKEDRARFYGMKDKMLEALWQLADSTKIEVNEHIATVQLGFDLPDGQPRPVFLLERTRSQGDYGDWRHYLSFVISFQDFRFPFHAIWDNAKDWLSAEVKAMLKFRDWTGDDNAPFTFGGRATTWVEAQAIPPDEVVMTLARLWEKITGKPYLNFLSSNEKFWASPPKLHRDEDFDENE